MRPIKIKVGLERYCGSYEGRVDLVAGVKKGRFVCNLKYRYEYDDRAIPYPKLSCDHHAALLVSVIVAKKL